MQGPLLAGGWVEGDYSDYFPGCIPRLRVLGLLLSDHSTGQDSLLLGLVTTPSHLQAEEGNRSKRDSTVPVTFLHIY